MYPSTMVLYVLCAVALTFCSYKTLQLSFSDTFKLLILHLYYMSEAYTKSIVMRQPTRTLNLKDIVIILSVPKSFVRLAWSLTGMLIRSLLNEQEKE